MEVANVEELQNENKMFEVNRLIMVLSMKSELR